MNALCHVPGGGADQRVQAGQLLDLTAPDTADGLTVFRRTLYLRVPLDAACDRLALAPGSTLALRFEPCPVVVERGDGAWVRRWSGAFGTVQVELAYPAPLTRVDSDLYGKAGLHRVDGEAVSAQPTVSGSTGAALSEPFVGTAFEVRLEGEKPGLRALGKARQVAKQHAHRSLSAAAVHDTHVSAADPAMRAVDRVVELRGGLTALHLAGTPGSPRLTLRSADGAQVLWQWIEPGPQAAAVDYAPSDLAADWQAALEQALTRTDAAGARPAALVLPLEVASDSPCRVRVQQAGVDVLLEAPLLPAPAVLRFDGVAHARQTLALVPPAGARRVEVHIRYAADADTAAGTPAAALPQTGVYLAAGASATATLTLPAPLRCAGAAIGWHALDTVTALEVSLLAPPDAPRPLATASLETGHAAPGMLYARWPAADLQGGPCQVRVTVREGAGVWAGAPHAEGRVRLDGTDGGPPRTVALAPTLSLLGSGESADTPVTMQLGGVMLAPDAQPGSGQGARSLRLDPVAAALAAQAQWVLEAGAAQPLTLTVDAVRVGYAAP